MDPRSEQHGEAGPAARWWIVAILLATFAAYVPAMRAGFIWDDDDYLTENPLIHEPGGLTAIWTTTRTPQYYPLVFSSFWLEYRLWGLDPAGYHVVNVALHAATAILAGLVLRALRVRGAWWVALLFAVHPVHVESVAWITERKNVLSGAFYLASALAYLRFDRSGSRGSYALALGLFPLALLSKTVTSTLPLALALALLHLRGRLRPRDALRLAPFLALSVSLPLITVQLENRMVDFVRADFAFEWWQRLSIAARALLFYPSKVVLPYPLIFNYPRWSLDPASAAGPALGSLLLAAGAAWLWFRGYRGIVLALAFYVLTIAPALGFFDVYPFRYSFVADHFQYLASLGALIVVVQAGLWLGSRLEARSGSGLARGLAVGLLVLLAVLTWRQAGAYRDEETLWLDTLAKNPDSWIAHNNLGSIHLERDDPRGALARYDEAIRCKPTSAESWTGRGIALTRLNEHAAAGQALSRALDLDPTYSLALYHRGTLGLESGGFEAAVRDLTLFLSVNPEYMPAYRTRAMAHVRAGRLESGLADIDRAIELGASYEARNDRGAVLVKLGRPAEAVEEFTHAIAASPGEARLLVNRGLAYAGSGRTERACADWKLACDLGDCRLFGARCAAN